MERVNIGALDVPEIVERLFNRSEFMKREGSASAPTKCERSDITLEASDGTPLNCRCFLAEPDKPHIIYFPAEYETEETLGMLAEGMAEYGFNILSLDYRGVGKSGGEPSFKHLPEDAESFFTGVKKWMAENGRDGKLVIMGRSLGSAPAIMAAEKFQEEILCLVIESGFNLTTDFLAGREISQEALDAVCPNGEDLFENREGMKKIKKPVLFIHSPRDQVQTLSQVEWLVVESRSKATQFQVAPSGTREELAHTAGELYCSILRQYINLRMGIRPARKPRHKRVLH